MISVADTYVSNTFTSAITNPSIAYNFKITAAGDVRVTKISAAGVKTTLANPADYTLTGVGNANGGFLNLIGAYAISDKVVMDIIVPSTQTDTYSYVAAWPSAVIEAAFDKLVNLGKRILSKSERAIRLPVEDLGDSSVLPIKASRANMVVGFDSGGDMALKADNLLTLTPRTKSYSMGSQTTKAVLTLTPVNDTNTEIEVWASVLSTGRLRYKKYVITAVTADAAAVVTAVDDRLDGKNGEEAVNISSSVASKVVTLTLDSTDAQNAGNGLQTTRNVAVAIRVNSVANISDLAVSFA